MKNESNTFRVTVGALKLTYKAADARGAALKAHEYLKRGGPYHDLWSYAKNPKLIFRVKKVGAPRDENAVEIEQCVFL